MTQYLPVIEIVMGSIPYKINVRRPTAALISVTCQCLTNITDFVCFLKKDNCNIKKYNIAKSYETV